MVYNAIPHYTCNQYKILGKKRKREGESKEKETSGGGRKISEASEESQERSGKQRAEG